MKSLVIAGVLSILLCAGCATQPGAPQKSSAPPKQFSGATPLEWSQRLADSEIARRGDSLAWQPGGKAKWDYTAGLFTLSLLKLNEQIPTPRYVEFAKQTIGSFISDNGQIQTYNRGEFQLDALNPGKTALALWNLTGEPRYQKAAAILRFQLNSQPRTSGRRLLAQAKIHKPNVARRDLHGRAVLCGVRKDHPAKTAISRMWRRRSA